MPVAMRALPFFESVTYVRVFRMKSHALATAGRRRLIVVGAWEI